MVGDKKKTKPQFYAYDLPTKCDQRIHPNIYMSGPMLDNREYKDEKTKMLI